MMGQFLNLYYGTAVWNSLQSFVLYVSLQTDWHVIIQSVLTSRHWLYCVLFGCGVSVLQNKHPKLSVITRTLWNTGPNGRAVMQFKPNSGRCSVYALDSCYFICTFAAVTKNESGCSWPWRVGHGWSFMFGSASVWVPGSIFIFTLSASSSEIRGFALKLVTMS